MRVLHLSSASSWRGGEQQIAYLVQELEARGHEQFIYCPLGSPLEKHMKAQAHAYFTYRKKGSINLLASRRLAKLAKKKAVDLIHIHDSHAHNLAVIAHRFFGMRTKLILSRRVDFPIKSNRFSKWKYNHPAIQKILCVSENIAQIIKPSIKDHSKIQVVHSGVKTSKFKYMDRGLLKKEYGIESNAQIIANIAAVADHKDYFTFVQVAEQLLKENLNYYFFIIGSDGGQFEEIKKYIESKNLEDQIFMTGFRNDIEKILPGIDLLLFTSKTEGLGTSILDAIACKVPVVSTLAGGIPEIIENEKSGLLAPVGDYKQLASNVKRILNNKALKTELVDNAFKVLDAFSTAEMAKKTIEAYQAVKMA